MASMERDRGLEKKREGPGAVVIKRKVFESKKEKKKRRLILSESESDEENYVMSARKKVLAAPPADQNGDSSLVEEKNSADCSSIEERVLESTVVKKKEHADGDENIIKKKDSIDRRMVAQKIKVESERALESTVVKKKEEAHGDEKIIKKKDSIDRRLVAQKIEVEPERGLESTVGKKKEEADEKIIKKKDSIDRRLVAQKIDVEAVRGLESTVGKKKEEADEKIIKKKDSIDRRMVAQKIEVEAERGLESTVGKKKEEADGDEKIIKKKDHIDRQMVAQKIGVEPERGLESMVGKKEEADGDEKIIKKKDSIDRRLVAQKIDIESERVLESTVGKKKEEADGDEKIIKKKDSIDRRMVAQKTKVELKRVLRSEVVKLREEAESDKKKATELGLERKRSREANEGENSAKKIKLESMNCESGKSMKKDYVKYGDKRTIASGGRKRDELNESNLIKGAKDKVEKVRWMERSGQRELRMLKDKSSHPASAKRDEQGISQQKAIRVQGKGGVLRVLPSNKKVDGLKEARVQREDEEKLKSASKHPLLSREIKGIQKSNSAVDLSGNQSNSSKGSSARRGRPPKVKTELEVLAPKRKSYNADSSNGRNDFSAKEESKSKSKASAVIEHSSNEESRGRQTVKQRVRDEIKKILLDAGWKIDLRPRRGRAYEDAVYVPPTGGAGYWSITKAYAVYLEQTNSEHGNKKKDISRKSPKQSTGTDDSHEGTSSAVASIPLDLLSMLKRNVVNKRRKRAEIDEARTKLGVIRKGKKIYRMKDSKNSNSKDNRGGNVRKKMKPDVHVVCSTSKKLQLKVRNKKRRGCALLVRGASQEADADEDDYIPYVWKRTVLSWMIDLGIIRENAKVRYMNKRQTLVRQVGWIKRDGICCGCCSKIVTASKFELHAGSRKQQPYQNILVEEIKISLLQCLLNAWEQQELSQRQSFYTIDIDGDDPNDDTCGICGDGGDLICCDGCPSTFHLSCLGIQMLPPGDWHCTHCSCKFCGLVSDAASEGSGVIVSSLHSCTQCEQKFHEECIPEADAISVTSKNSATSFCGQGCRKVFKCLQKLIGINNDLEAGFSWSLIRRFDDTSEPPRGLSQRAECNAKIAVALAVMDECFLPIVDHRSGINLIHNIVYNCGSNITRLSYGGFYTFILERGNEVISVASVRIHGTRLAEMPFIGTRNMYRRQGMCRRLLNGIESALHSLNVEKLIIPAISELVETWTTVFGFKPLEVSQKQEVKSINMLVFPGTGLLQKPILKKDSAEQHTIADGAEIVIKHRDASQEANESSAHHFVGSDLPASDEVVGSPKHDAKDVEPILPTSGSFDVPHESEIQAPDKKFLESSCDVDSLVLPEVVYSNGAEGENTLQISSSNKLKIELPFEGAVHDVHEEKREMDSVGPSLYAIDGSSIQLASEDRCISADTNVCALQDSGENTKTAPNLLGTKGVMLQHKLEAQSTCPDVPSSTLQDSGENCLQIPVCSLKLSSNATEGYKETNRSCLPAPEEHSVLASSEHIVDHKYDMEDKSTLSQAELNAFGDISEQYNSGVTTAPICSMAKEYVSDSVGTGIHTITAGAPADIHEMTAEVINAKPKSDEKDVDDELHTAGDVDKPLNTVPRKEGQASASKAYGTDTITALASDYESPDKIATQQTIEVLQKPLQCAVAAFPTATETINRSKYDLVNTDLISNSAGMLNASHETNVGSGSFEQYPCYLVKNPSQIHNSVMGNRPPCVGCEPSIGLCSCGVKNHEMPDEASHFEGTPLSAANIDNQREQTVANDSVLLVSSGDTCASSKDVLLDTGNVKSEKASVTHGHHAIDGSLKTLSAEGAAGLDGKSDCNGTTFGELSNGFEVQHVLKNENIVAVDLPVENGLSCSEGVLDSTPEENESTAAEPNYSFGLSSDHCASKVATKCLGNSPEISNDSAEVSIL